MNQNTTIETLREVIGILDCVYDDDKYDRKRIISAAATLCDLANRLESAPQPPVEQSEPKSGFWIDGEWREIVLANFAGTCPVCLNRTQQRRCECGALFMNVIGDIPSGPFLWLAPPAVIEPEPELDEFEQWLTAPLADCNMQPDRELILEKYREIISRKGDK